MANRKGLRLLGWAYGGLTAIVSVIAIVVVTAHINTAVEARPEIVASSTQ
jgi:hypothetical protein